MNSYSLSFPLLLAVSVLHGAPVYSNSPHSPYTQLKTLKEDVSTLKEALEKIKTEEGAAGALLEENKQLTFRLEQLETENENLKSSLANLDEVYKKQTQELLALSKEFDQFRSNGGETNSDAVKSHELVSVKEDISQIKDTLVELGNFEKKWEDNGGKNSQVFQAQLQGLKTELVRMTDEKLQDLTKQMNSQNFQDQLQKIKSEFLTFCQTTNEKLQDFSKQMKSNLMKMSRNGCIRHTIVAGESLGSIARLYKITPDQILSANCLQDTRGLHVGDTLLIPQEVFLE